MCPALRCPTLPRQKKPDSAKLRIKAANCRTTPKAFNVLGAIALLQRCFRRLGALALKQVRQEYSSGGQLYYY